MLFWKSFFLLLFLLICWGLFINTTTLLNLILHGELLLILLFIGLSFLAVFFNIDWIFGFNFCILILGSLELALNLILLAI